MVYVLKLVINLPISKDFIFKNNRYTLITIGIAYF